jgi:hypothetical protein
MRGWQNFEWTEEEQKLFDFLEEKRYEEVVETSRELEAKGNGTWKWLQPMYELAREKEEEQADEGN